MCLHCSLSKAIHFINYYTQTHLFDIQTFSNMTIIKTAHTEKKREMKSMNAPAPVLFPMVDKELIHPLQVSNQHIVQTVQLKVSSNDFIWPKWQLVFIKLNDKSSKLLILICSQIRWGHLIGWQPGIIQWQHPITAKYTGRKPQPLGTLRF